MDVNTCRWRTNGGRPTLGHRKWLILLVFVSLIAGPWTRVGAAEPGLQILPTSTQIASSAPARVYVIVRNTSTDMVYEGVKVSIPDVPDDDPELRIEYPQGARNLEPGYDHAYELRLWPRRADPVTRTVHPRVEYISRSRAGSSGAPRVEFTTLEVKTREPAQPDKVASLEIQTTLEGLQQHRPGKLYLIITNKLGDVLRIDRIDWHKPDFIRLGAYRPSCESSPDPAAENAKKEPRFCEWKDLTEAQFGQQLTVAPYQSRTVELDVEATGQIQPGKHLLLFDVQFGSAGGLARNLVVSRALDVSVMGESEILKALGIPTLLLLPGFLVMVSAAVVWRWKRLRLEGDPSTFPFGYTSPEFITAGVTCSLLITAAFELLSQRDYLRMYGLSDIMRTWAISLVLGAGGCVGVMLARKSLHDSRAPLPGDDPEKTLSKLARRGMKLRLQRRQAKLGSAVHPVFLLEPIPGDASQLFCVCPIIVVNAPTDSMLRAALKTCLDEQEGAGNSRSLLKLIRTHKSKVSLAWDPSNGLTAVSRIKADQLGDPLAPMYIVRFD